MLLKRLKGDTRQSKYPEFKNDESLQRLFFIIILATKMSKDVMPDLTRDL
jgi:hypothetical protein